MKLPLKQAKTILRDSTRSEYEHIVYQANMPPLAERCLRYAVIYRRTVIEISMELSVSEATVKRNLHEAYRKVALFLKLI